MSKLKIINNKKITIYYIIIFVISIFVLYTMFSKSNDFIEQDNQNVFTYTGQFVSIETYNRGQTIIELHNQTFVCRTDRIDTQQLYFIPGQTYEFTIRERQTQLISITPILGD